MGSIVPSTMFVSNAFCAAKTAAETNAAMNPTRLAAMGPASLSQAVGSAVLAP